MKKITTVTDARIAKQQAWDKTHPEPAGIANKKELENMQFSILHPQIGMIIKGGKQMFYTYPAGGVYTENRDPRKLV